MTRAACLIAAMASLLLVGGCGGPSCAERGGVRVQDASITVMSCASYGKYGCTVWYPIQIPQSHCVIPKGGVP